MYLTSNKVDIIMILDFGCSLLYLQYHRAYLSESEQAMPTIAGIYMPW